MIKFSIGFLIHLSFIQESDLESHRFRDQSSIDKGRREESRCRVLGSHLQDLRSACLVLLRSRGVVLVAGAFVAVFTRDSSSSSTPSARLPLVLSSLSTGPSVIIRPATERDFSLCLSIDKTLYLSAPLFEYINALRALYLFSLLLREKCLLN